MKVKIVVEDVTPLYNGKKLEMQRSQVWEGELELLKENTYITKISMIAEGQEHPICDIPFSIDTGHWIWVPGLDLTPRRYTGLVVEADTISAYPDNLTVEPEPWPYDAPKITQAALDGPQPTGEN